MLFPRARGDLVGNQSIRGVRVRYAQQRLRQAHQNDALGRGQVVFAQKGIQAGARRACGAHGLNERQAPCLHGSGVGGR